MGDKRYRRRKEDGFSAPVVELIAAPAADADSRLRRALDMVLATAARQSEDLGTRADEDDSGEGDTSQPRYVHGDAGGAEP